MSKTLHLAQYRAAIFDLDGTLVISEPAWEQAKRRVLTRHGISVSQEVLDAFVGRGLRGFLAEVAGPGLTPERQTDLANQIGAEADVLLPQLRQPIPGAASLLHRLTGAGVRVAVCSSSPRRHIDAALAMLGVLPQVQVIVSAADLPRGKPDPLPYLETLRLLDLPAAQAFAIEDALPGVLSAEAAGLAVLGVGAQGRSADFAQRCHFCVNDLADLPTRFKGL